MKRCNLNNQREKEGKGDYPTMLHEKKARYKRNMETLKGNLDIAGYRELLEYV